MKRQIGTAVEERVPVVPKKNQGSFYVASDCWVHSLSHFPDV